MKIPFDALILYDKKFPPKLTPEEIDFIIILSPLLITFAITATELHSKNQAFFLLYTTAPASTTILISARIIYNAIGVESPVPGPGSTDVPASAST